jgi:galactose-1-phosphate uridylyltransferase
MINILKGAQRELDDAFEYYESQMAGLGNEFIEEFEKATQRIIQFPEAWHPFSPNTRRCQFNRFPCRKSPLKQF